MTFAEALLDDLYRNHGCYVSKIARTIEWNLLNGFIVVEDAEWTIRDGTQSDVGHGDHVVNW